MIATMRECVRREAVPHLLASGEGTVIAINQPLNESNEVGVGLEIERKFLLKNDDWRKLAQGKEYRQGYLSSVKERTVRVRTIEDKGFLTIKGVSRGAVRTEYEYAIPLNEAKAMLEELCEKPLIEKKRFKIPYEGLVWEIDEFFGENKGLIMAEAELSSETQAFNKPEWIGVEVTHDSKYYNANLVHHPFRRW